MLQQYPVLLIQLQRLPEARSAVDRLLNLPLFTIGQTPVTLMTVLTVALILRLMRVLARAAQRGTRRVFAALNDAGMPEYVIPPAIASASRASGTIPFPQRDVHVMPRV